MPNLKPIVMTLACAVAAVPEAGAQLGMFSNEQRVALTARRPKK